MRLSELEAGRSAVIVKVFGHGGFRRRILEMGFVRGKEVTVLLNAPLKDPIKYKIMNYEVSLRRSEASMIEVVSSDEAAARCTEVEWQGTGEETMRQVADERGREINIALVGNPNSGKTSLFNAASGGHEHVGNYSGVTVDAKRGAFEYGGYRFVIYDLPGTYALSAYTPEEVYVRRHLTDTPPDVIVNVVVASNLERNLYLTTELIDMNPKMVVALNMYDELENSGSTLDYESLGGMMGVPFVPTVSRTGRGLEELYDTIIAVYENRDSRVRHIHINHSPVIEEAIRDLSAELRADGSLPHCFPPRYWAIKLLERDLETERMLSAHEGYASWSAVRDRGAQRIEKQLGEDVETAVADEKYGFISGALRETFLPSGQDEIRATHVIDSFVTHKLFGFPIFILIMWLMFEATFSLGQYPMDWIEKGVDLLGGFLGRTLPEGSLKSLLVDGIIGGVGGVIVFLPNILILYLCISFMEDSGYMARAAFIMDKIMHKIGLHGKSFIPLIMGFGCNVPAVMASRTIESRSSRIITILINPFMSCSARLPVYIFIVGIFFPRRAGLVLAGLYLLGVLLAIVTARIMRRFLFTVDETPFVMELPPYRMPTARSIVRHMWDKAAQYLRKMGGIILLASIIVWFLNYYPHDSGPVPVAGPAAAVSVDSMEAGAGMGEAAAGQDYAAGAETAAGERSESYLARLGRLCEPVVKPLGFNWKLSIALLTGMVAKEMIVSTLGVLYADSGDVDDATLSQRIMAVNPATGEPDMNVASALAFLIFVLIYCPCVATLAAIANETGSWKWAVASFAYNTALAWVVAWAAYHIALLFI